VLIGIDQRIERGPIDQPLLHQQRFERFDPQSYIGRNVLVIVLFGMGEIMRRRSARGRHGGGQHIASGCVH
jgi:hypothetical protein